MRYVRVKFLGEEYQVPESVNEFLNYDRLLNPMREKLLKMMTDDLKWDSKNMTFGPEVTEHVVGKISSYANLVDEVAELLVKKLYEQGVYDVTASDLLNNITAINDISEAGKSAMYKMIAEGQKIADMKNAGMERAYKYAASNVTGSGVTLFTNSLASLMIHSAVEGSILRSQAKKADKEYDEAVRAINARTRRAADKMCSEVMVGEFYPPVLEILLEFDRLVMSNFLAQLTVREKFDFNSFEHYNMQKAEEMLKNINQIPNKVEFLKQTFLICPFTSELYGACFKQGLLDQDTFETARYFGVEGELVDEIDTYIKNNLKDSEKVNPLITILASYRETDEMTIWRSLYEDTLCSVEREYKVFNDAISNRRNLDKFVRDEVSNQMIEVVDKSSGIIEQIIDRKMKKLISEIQYDEFVEKGIISPATIRMTNSSSVSLTDINSEIKSALVECIMEYIAEAKKRLDAYDRAKEVFDNELCKKEEELSALKSEKAKLGLFALSKKKEMNALIENKESEILEFRSSQEPKDLWLDFERMYR